MTSACRRSCWRHRRHGARFIGIFRRRMDDLLLACCEEHFAGLYRHMQEEPSYTFHDMSLGYYSYWDEHREFLQLLQKRNLLQFFASNLDRFLYSVAAGAHEAEDGSAPPAKMIYHFFCSMSAMSHVRHERHPHVLAELGLQRVRGAARPILRLLPRRRQRGRPRLSLLPRAPDVPLQAHAGVGAPGNITPFAQARM